LKLFYDIFVLKLGMMSSHYNPAKAARGLNILQDGMMSQVSPN
jgi:hypothetical protein